MIKKAKDEKNIYGYITAICPQCGEFYFLNDTKGVYNDVPPTDILCPECTRINNNLKRIEEFTSKNNIKNRSIIKLMKHVMFYDKDSTKKRMNSIYKEAQKIYKLQKEEKKLTKL